jgi:hypothetical protein
MDRRKRVQEVLKHKEFCAELESKIRPGYLNKAEEELVTTTYPPTQMSLPSLHNISRSNNSLQQCLVIFRKQPGSQANFRSYELSQIFQYRKDCSKQACLSLPTY